MSVRSTVRAVLPAALLATVAVLTSACATAEGGVAVTAATTASSAATPVSSSSDAPTVTQVPTPVTDPSEPSTSPTAPTSTEIEPTEPSEPTQEPTESGEPTGPAHPSSFDQVTGVWTDTMCTDVQTFLGTIMAVPSVAIADGAEQYREAWLDYLGGAAYQMEAMVGNMSAIDPPNLPNGAEVHKRYVAYFTALKEATVKGWELVDAVSTDDPKAVAEIVEQATQMMQGASSPDMGMGDLVGAEYKAVMEQIDSCAPLLQG